MTDHAQLPFLIRLLDDDTPEVQEAVWRELRAYGEGLGEALSSVPELSAEQREKILATIAVDSPEDTVVEKAQFQIGQLVKHRRHGYRGVIVAYDEECQADKEWYEHNRTQPDRSQPWYHVLVHMSAEVTYAAQSNLEADDSDQVVVHPLAALFFTGFSDGHYERNDRPWPGHWPQ